MENNKNIKNFKCSCGGEILEITYWPEEKEYCVEMYAQHSIDVDFWTRVKNAYDHVFKRKFFPCNGIFIDSSKAKEFADFINNPDGGK
jgi:hypothetical protein